MRGPIVPGSTSMRLLLLAAVGMATVLIPVPAQAAGDTLHQSVQQLQRFPFRPDCDGNTQEIVACQWRQRNQDDATLKRLLGSTALLEQWRASRRRVSERAATKAEGGLDPAHCLAELRDQPQCNFDPAHRRGAGRAD
jgi:hypothetical protein